MAANILTPSAIWGDFKIENTPEHSLIDRKKEGDIITERLYIDGRETSDGKVKIFATLMRSSKMSCAPAIFLLQDFNANGDERLLKAIAKKGYTVLTVDLVGLVEERDLYTVYPPSILYANYEDSKNELYVVETDAKKTCWYEWACVARYALKFLSEQEYVTKIGGFGIGQAATVMWQVAGTDTVLDCAVFVLNAGWESYRGIYKFGGMVEPQFSDNSLKFIAGIEPQSYAMHVKCPVYMLSATNSGKFDCDRVFDTLSKIGDDIYSAVHYSVNCFDRVNVQAFNSAMVFFGEFLAHKEDGVTIASDIEVGTEICDGKIAVTVNPEKGQIKKVELFVAEQVVKPVSRCWKKITDRVENKDGSYTFYIMPYQQSSSVTVFAQVEYENGLVIGSRIINKKFKPEEIIHSHKSNILYSSREKNADSMFTADYSLEDNPPSVEIDHKKGVKVKKGPMAIDGITAEGGLLTFKFSAIKDKPQEGSLLMLDVYSKEKTTLTVKLISDFANSRTEYAVNLALTGGDVWQNVKIDLSKFKTQEGMSLKNLDTVEAIKISVDSKDYLINNALWV